MVLVVIAVAGFVTYRLEEKHAEKNHTTASEEVKAWVTAELAKLKQAQQQQQPPPSPISTGKSESNKPQVVIPKSNLGSVHYDPSAGLHPYNPFDFETGDWYGSVVVPPPLEYVDDDEGEDGSDSNLGFLIQPNIFDGTLVFVTEGDLYITSVDFPNAIKLTTTVGNVRTPILNPVFPYYVAFTATYTGRREAYLMDLRKTKRGQPAMRLTYWDSSTGISAIVGWKNDGLTLVFSASSREVGLPDTRLYTLSLAQEGEERKLTERRTSHLPLKILEIKPVPLSQAIDGVWDDINHCVYFTRFSQSSKTARYVGGTAESIWVYCEGQASATEITRNSDYHGTSKSPKLMKMNGQDYLLFLSDRVKNSGGDWIPSSMNLFALLLPGEDDLYSTVQTSFIQISDVSCDNGGLALMEYDVDSVSNRIVMRIGADLYSMSGEEVEARIAGNHEELAHEIQKIPIVVYSDFHEHQERILPLKVPDHITSLDVFETAFGTTAVLLGMRGQLFVNPVIEDLEAVNKYEGAGMNLPARRYRVAPGSSTGGVVRVLAARFLPVLHEEGKTGRRLALILATDPISETAEHAFYLIEIQNDSAPSFVDLEDLPSPFIGGHIAGGSVALGGLGSVNPDSVTVSPCGRRLAWTDTDGRICVMTIPLYETGINKCVVLPTENERNEPMIGAEAELSWSPGGHYLAITHSARNQFSIISIADCGDPGGEDPEVIFPVQLGRIVQATPDRFNSASCYWGKTTLDILLQSASPAIAAMLGDDGDSITEGSTTLFFLSDRDIVSDVGSPWGTRIPSPHFPQKYAVYALPLIGDDQRNSSLSPSKGLYGGGGGTAELWTDAIIALDGQLEDLMNTTMSAGNSASRRLQMAAAARSQQMHMNKKIADQKSNEKRRFEKVTSQSRILDSDDSAGNAPTSAQDSAGQDEHDAPVTLPTSSPSTALTAVPIAVTTTSATNEPIAGPADEAPTSARTDGSASATTSTPASLLTSTPSNIPSTALTNAPTGRPTKAPTDAKQTHAPTKATRHPTTSTPIVEPTTRTKRTNAPTKATRHPTSTPTVEPTTMQPTTSAPSAGPPKAKSPFPKDAPIDFGPLDDLSFARKAYRIAGIPAGKYSSIVSQSTDDGSLVLTETGADSKPLVKIFSVDDFPSDKIEAVPVSPPGMQFMGVSLSTTREYILFIYSGTFKVVANTAKGLGALISDTKFVTNIVDTSDMFVSIWPALEYQQLYNDAWRLLRDYFYDTGMNGVDWPAMHERYKKLVKRCSKREELDDILGQMAAELSALHVFVYGGEYGDPLFGDQQLSTAHAVASLGATLDRTPEYKGYRVSSIPERDPDFNMVDGTAMYSPLSDTALHLSGQRGLQVGDVIVGVNGESVMRVPDIHMLLRGQAGRSIRLDVLRLTSSGADPSSTSTDLVPEPVIVVPISGDEAANLRYAAWEYKTREMAKSMAKSKGFSTGYVHLRSMSGPEDIDAFFRGFFSDYDKQGLIIDVRHNRGGNIDSWLLDILQRRAWMYWQGRATNIYNGGLGWDEQFAFRGHLVVLIDEHTSSDGEGFARGVSELGLGKLIGRRTWGGGIWLSSDNRLVDGGIASAPEIGTYNNNFGWGLGIEQMGVEPDVAVDNNPRTAYDGKDDQLEAAITYLADWIEREPIVDPREPGEKKDRSMPREGLECKVGRAKKRYQV